MLKKKKNTNTKHIDTFQGPKLQWKYRQEENFSQLPLLDFQISFGKPSKQWCYTANIYSHHPEESTEIPGGLQNFPTQNSTIETTLLMRHIGEEQLEWSGI